MTAASRLSSGCVSALLAAAALGLGACGGHDGRAAVNRYLESVNEVQHRSQADFTKANRAYARFSQGKLRAAEAISEFGQAERAMRVTHDELAALKPPPPAVRLHRLVLRLYEFDQSFAHESTLLARYLPAQTAAMRPLAAAGRGLRSDLRRPGAAAQAHGFARYAARLGRVLRRLARLRPPPILVQLQRDELRRLGSAQGLARRLATAVAGRDSATVARLLLRFRKLAGARANSAFTAAGVAAYARRHEAVNAAAAAVERERGRLDRSLR